MKVIKALKKLKLWSRKKKKYRLLGKGSPPPPSRRPPPPPPYHRANSQYEPFLPSAPPLPPWLEYDLQFEEMSKVSLDNSISKHDHPPPELEANASCYQQYDLRFEEMHSPSKVSLDNSLSKPDLPPPELEANASCYHQYTVYNDINTNQVARLETVGAFGCAVSFAGHLLRCVFPCFHIREDAAKFK